MNRREVLRFIGVQTVVGLGFVVPLARAQRQSVGTTSAEAFNLILGRASVNGITLSLFSAQPEQARLEYGESPTALNQQSTLTLKAGEFLEVGLSGLKPSTRYHYRLLRGNGTALSGQFQTGRNQGEAFTFAVQGDSHPERVGKMFDETLYQRTLQLVAQHQPDFYVLMGDDFSLDRLVESKTYTTQTVDAIYARQRAWLSAVGGTMPLYLMNGNHEHAFQTYLDNTDKNPAVLAGLSRNKHFPLPAPDGFYSGNATPLAFVGLLRNYYAWTWGDALFVVMDPYWHSSVEVDGDGGRKEPWKITLGDQQYAWLQKTLLESRAKHKFVFAHHVQGTGRGGIEVADNYEWGGKERNGADGFAKNRPNWTLPIHQLMVRARVSIFFQGHDHLFAHQEKDGLVYQTVPNPADPTYTAFNREAYKSGTMLPNSGFLKISVTPQQSQVQYIRSFQSKDESKDQQHGAVAYSYTVAARGES